eukprot:scaffold2066_cov229-Ochromonas_danica.AAC.29
MLCALADDASAVVGDHRARVVHHVEAQRNPPAAVQQLHLKTFRPLIAPEEGLSVLCSWLGA